MAYAKFTTPSYVLAQGERCCWSKGGRVALNISNCISLQRFTKPDKQGNTRGVVPARRLFTFVALLQGLQDKRQE